ncbi:MAG: UDP-2,3-diacylglucosamine diphosphatase LpxI [Alphaproteobacteria bacterium]|nr:UDP-2,3-diacylglucosamine diphosphatase LpxI [Alphaproteobacteria bacterium]MBR5567074.1 UDP-2,3-diacylglucosamine diphosphatase LpxI [Alphaproteobacteria bacterium]
MQNKNTDKKIALVAGALDLPFFTRDALRRAGWDVFVVGLKNFVDPRLAPDMVVRLGGAGRAIREFRRRGIKKLTFVGALGHPNFSDLRPDLWTFMTLLKIMKHQRGYDSMAVALNNVLEKQGFEIVAAQDLAPELTFEVAGPQTRAKPSASDRRNIERAIEVSHTIGAADIGASVVVDSQVIAVEAAEGTARMLERVVDMRKNKRKPSGVFAKMTKPNQDLRIDIPAIGVDTVNAVAAAHLRGIVVNTRTCFVVNKPAVIRQANKLGIFILALDE